jgi:hypothetical protein
MGQSENKIKTNILAYLKLHKIFAWPSENYRAHGRAFIGEPGMPDITGMLPGGRFLGIEVKTATGKQSDNQKAFQARCDKEGGLYILARSLDDVTAVLPWGEDNG